MWTANAADNQPLDADSAITITGGTVLAAGGSAGMGYTIDASQGYVTYGSGMGGGQNGMTPPDGTNGQTPPAMNGSAPGVPQPPERSAFANK